MAINNRTAVAVMGDVTDVDTTESRFRSGVDDIITQIDADQIKLNDASAADLTKLSNVTASATELNILDGATVTTAELNRLDGLTASTTELNLLDGLAKTPGFTTFTGFTSSGTFTKPAGVTVLKYVLIGGGVFYQSAPNNEILLQDGWKQIGLLFTPSAQTNISVSIGAGINTSSIAQSASTANRGGVTSVSIGGTTLLQAEGGFASNSLGSDAHVTYDKSFVGSPAIYYYDVVNLNTLTAYEVFVEQSYAFNDRLIATSFAGSSSPVQHGFGIGLQAFSNSGISQRHGASSASQSASTQVGSNGYCAFIY